MRKEDCGTINAAVGSLKARNQIRANTSQDPAKWHLPELIEVAAELRLIKDGTVTQARLAKEYRNLIHPGRENRLQQCCDRPEALSAVSAVEHVIRDLQRS